MLATPETMGETRRRFCTRDGRRLRAFHCRGHVVVAPRGSLPRQTMHGRWRDTQWNKERRANHRPELGLEFTLVSVVEPHAVEREGDSEGFPLFVSGSVGLCGSQRARLVPRVDGGGF